jgi:hypothetical protein
MDKYTMSAMIKIWKWVLLDAVLLATSIFLFVSFIPSALAAAFFFIGLGALVGGGFLIYEACAATFFWIHKQGSGSSGSDAAYKRRTRLLKRKVREKRRKLWSYKNYGSVDDYYADAIKAERELAAHLEQDYEEPERKPTSRRY